MSKVVDLVSKLPKPEKFNVTLILHDINGEYGEKTVQIDDEPIYDITDKKKIQKFLKEGYHEEQCEKDGETHTILTRKVVKKVHSFPRNGKNQPLIPLGSTRGYIVGTLKACARTIGVRQGGPLYGILSWLDNGGVKIPHWIPVPVDTISTANYFVKEAKQMMYYEQIKEAEVTIPVQVMSRGGFNAKLIQELLKRAAGIGISPKRRGTFEVVGFS